MPLNNIISPTISYNMKVSVNNGSINPVVGQNVTIGPVGSGGSGSGGVSTLGELTDVTEVLKQDGAMLQWEANNSAYEIKFITIDSGTF